MAVMRVQGTNVFILMAQPLPKPFVLMVLILEVIARVR